MFKQELYWLSQESLHAFPGPEGPDRGYDGQFLVLESVYNLKQLPELNSLFTLLQVRHGRGMPPTGEPDP